MIPNLPRNLSTITKQEPNLRTEEGCKDRLEQLRLFDLFHRETSELRELEKIKIEYLLSKFN